MSKRTKVTPYAKALFDVALTSSRQEATGQELAGIVAEISRHPDVSRALQHRAVPIRVKRDVIDRLASEAQVSTPLRKLLILLAERDRLGQLQELHDAYQARLLQHLGIVEAQVTTAVALSPDRAAALAKGLERATGKQVRLTTKVDPAIMGGVVARLGSTVYDGSVARHLERLRDKLGHDKI